MSRRVLAGFGPVSAGGLPELLRAAEAMAAGTGRPGVGGFVFLDPEDGLRPVALVPELRRAAPAAEVVVVPLVCRDANRTALLGEARSAEVLGARGLLLLAGHLDSGNPAPAVYDLDPLQLLGFLREHGVGLELWVAGRCGTPAERARLAALAEAGAARCVVPWEPGDPATEAVGLPASAWVAEELWSQGVLPEGEADLLLQVGPGGGPAARELTARLQGAG